ncbi:MAG: hypothetical protein DME99_00935 [Verrucomicrobia bacterium]|nr:MAG: hypothetical protein DME99_00935 [Verrucomicrobiota bacterium]
MKTNSLKIIAAVVAGLFVLGTTVHAQGPLGAGAAHNVIVGKSITKVEAEKKYPPSKGGGYPTGERDPHDPSGVVASPYPPHQKFDCSKISHGGLVLDATANKVFVRP